MSERLTERNANGTAKSRKSPKSSYIGTVYEEMAEIQTEILGRLCDLEDKIEQGKMLELPCAVGQTVYYPIHHLNKVEELEVCEIAYRRGKMFIYVSYMIFTVDSIGKSVFLDRASAEAKLREMEGDNNEQR